MRIKEVIRAHEAGCLTAAGAIDEILGEFPEIDLDELFVIFPKNTVRSALQRLKYRVVKSSQIVTTDLNQPALELDIYREIDEETPGTISEIAHRLKDKYNRLDVVEAVRDLISAELLIQTKGAITINKAGAPE